MSAGAAIIVVGTRVRHRKRGSTYVIRHFGTLQMEGPQDMASMVIYQGEEDGRVWVRPWSEFFDGRFEVLG